MNATASTGLDVSHRAPDDGPTTLTERAAGGVAVGDIDQDGHQDVYVVRPGAANMLFLYDREGMFREEANGAGVSLAGEHGSGPLLFDYDGDGWLDLFVGATEGDSPHLFRNQQDGTFAETTTAMGLGRLGTTLSATAGDYDRDGWLDLFASHWSAESKLCHLWQNQKGKGYRCVDSEAGIDALPVVVVDQTFTANFADVDDDGWPDLLIASDFGTSSLLHNRGDGTFEALRSSRFTDQNGMGSAIGDYDGDGDLDWFVTSIFDGDGTTEGDWGTSGNRLYRNRGDGTFEDATDEAGVRDGNWGWAACFADLNLDGWLDLIHVNGWPQGSAQFRDSPSRLFLGRPDGRFVDLAAELGFTDRGDGRGLSCLDFDADGDVDLLVANRGGNLSLWRNDLVAATQAHFLQVRLEGEASNRYGVGAVVTLSANGHTQLRTMRAGSNYASQDPLLLQFGVAGATLIDEVSVRWPSGRVSLLRNVESDQTIVIDHADARLKAGGGCSVGW